MTMAAVDDAKILNRAMLCGVNDVQHELNLEQFDDALWKNLIDIGDNQLRRDPR